MDYKRYEFLLLGFVGLLPGCGDVVFESDPCRYLVGTHVVHLESFQGSTWTEKACDEIPNLGTASLTIDIPDRELRDMQTSIRIVAVDSRAAARKAGEHPQAGTELARWPAQTYPTGVIALTHNFQKAGYAAALLTFLDTKTGKSETLSLPLQVAMGAAPNWFLIFVIAAFLAATAGFYYMRVYRHRVRPVAV